MRHTPSPKNNDTHLAQRPQLLLVVQKKAQILIRNVYLRLASKPPMLLLRLPPTRKPMSINLVLDLVLGIAHKDTRIRIRSAHLRLRSLQGREESRVDQCRFGVFEFLGDVSRQSEVGVLVDGAGDEAGDVARFAKDLGKGVGEGGCGLDGTKVYLANVVSNERRSHVSLSKNKNI